jgi:putative ABC transport system ATP-binding protein
MSLEVSGLELVNGVQISFSLSAQQCLILQGESGVGKSLCLRALADLDPHQGQIHLEGVNQSETLPQQWRKQVQWVSAEPQWWEELVKEHFVELPSLPLLNQLGLPADIIHQKVAQTSVGQRQRLSLLRS